MKAKHIALIMAGLAVAIGLLAFLNAKDLPPVTGSLDIVYDGQVVRTYSGEEIQALPYIEVDKEVVSSDLSREKGLFRGVPLRTLIEDAGPELLDGATAVTTRAEDGYVSVFRIKSVAESDNILVVYSKDGALLGTRDEGGSGPFRVVIQEDPFGNRSAKYLYRIEVK